MLFKIFHKASYSAFEYVVAKIDNKRLVSDKILCIVYRMRNALWLSLIDVSYSRAVPLIAEHINNLLWHVVAEDYPYVFYACIYKVFHAVKYVRLVCYWYQLLRAGMRERTKPRA